MLFGNEPDYTLLRTTSKDALKRTALLAANNDIKKAAEIYDFFVKDMPNIPDYDPIPPSTLSQVRDTAAQIFQWGQQNQDQIVGAVNLVLQLMGKSPVGLPAAPVETPPPPIG